MTTYEEDRHVESIQPQVPGYHGPQDRTEHNIEDVSLEQSNRQHNDLLEKELGELDNKNDASRESIQVPPPDPPNKVENLAMPGSEEVIESEQARIERLGRERPAKFKSLGAELAFCYSIIASQFMAVCIDVAHCRRILETNSPNNR